MHSPAISIVIPSLNSERTIETAISSILRQTYGDFEILIIDGASTDRTIDIIKNYSEKDERVRFISEKDRGIYDAMNKGITLASGQWLYFMGSDDRLYNNTSLAAVLENRGIEDYHVIYGNVYSSHFNGVYDGEFNERKLYEKNICHQSIIVRKELFRITGNFDVRYKGHADWDHNLKWFLNPQIKKKYLDIIIAEYAAGGYSSTNADDKFSQEKEENILKYGGKSLERDFRILLYQSLANQRKLRKDFAGYLKYKFRSYLNMYA